jgi:hypothetical protein
MARPHRDPIALETTPRLDPATGETVWVRDGRAAFGNREPSEIVSHSGASTERAPWSPTTDRVVWVLEVRRAGVPLSARSEGRWSIVAP